MVKETGKTSIIYRTPTPVKELINNEFGNKHEEELLKNYNKLLSEVNINS